MEENIIIECICESMWYMDYEPTPPECIGKIWRLNMEYIYPNGERMITLGIWIDAEGNQVKI